MRVRSNTYACPIDSKWITILEYFAAGTQASAIEI